MVDELPWGIETLAAMTEKARSVCLQVEVDKEGTIYHRKAAVKDVKAVV